MNRPRVADQLASVAAWNKVLNLDRFAMWQTRDGWFGFEPVSFRRVSPAAAAAKSAAGARGSWMPPPPVCWPVRLLFFADENQQEGIIALLGMGELGRPAPRLRFLSPTQFQTVLPQLVDARGLAVAGSEIDLLRFLGRVQPKTPFLRIPGWVFHGERVPREDDSHSLH